MTLLARKLEHFEDIDINVKEIMVCAVYKSTLLVFVFIQSEVFFIKASSSIAWL